LKFFLIFGKFQFFRKIFPTCNLLFTLVEARLEFEEPILFVWDSGSLDLIGDLLGPLILD